jgi:uridine phosphorylase
MQFPDSELIINPDGSIYHLHLRPDQVAQTIITVGDPERVGEISKHFDKIEHKTQHREFVSHTGILSRGLPSERGVNITVISTGIGTDNIDIVLTELDALVNIDFETRTIKPKHTTLDIIRIGTSGSIQQMLPVDSLVVSTVGIGFDNLMHFYDADQEGDELVLADALGDYLEKKSEDLMLMPYVFKADKTLLNRFLSKDSFGENRGYIEGVTVTAPGFYAPQGRILRGGVAEPKLLKMLNGFKHKTTQLSNLEMETAGIYGMARLLEHRAISFSAILANRMDLTFSKTPQKTVEQLIEKVLQTLIP